MKKITDFINRYKFKKSYEYQIKSDFIDLINQEFNLSLTEKEVDLKNNIIYLRVGAKLKSFLILNKGKILNILNSQDSNNIKDIT